jgi:hypothetical protein
MKSIKTITRERTSDSLRSVRVGERKIPKKVISNKRIDTGICEICENAPTCIYKRDLKHPILNCEEFKAALPERSIYSAQRALINEINNKNNGYAGSTEDTEYKGLCANCEHRKLCIYPKPEGGVWSCEEYE